MARDMSARTEGSLLLLILPLLIGGLLLVFLAKTSLTVPANAIHLNAASAEELAVALELDPALASELVLLRNRRNGFLYAYEPASLSLFPSPSERADVASRLSRSAINVNTAGVDLLANELGISRAKARRVVEYRKTFADHRFPSREALLQTPWMDAQTLSQYGERLIVRTPGKAALSFAFNAGLLLVTLLLLPPMLRRRGIGGDPFLLPIACLLSGFGIIALFSIKDPLRDTPVYLSHIQGVWLGLAVFTLAAAVPARSGENRRWLSARLIRSPLQRKSRVAQSLMLLALLSPARSKMRRYTYLWAIASVALLLGLILFGTGPSGIRLNLFFFQPVELIKLFLMIFTACYLSDRSELLTDALHRWRPPLPKNWLARWRGLAMPRLQDSGPILLMFSLALVLFLVVRDMGPALLLFGAFISTLYIATGRLGVVWIGLLIMLAGGWLAYRIGIGVMPVRVDMWLHPWNNQHGSGMQLGQALWGMASGGLWGTGLGLGSPGTTPRAGSDMIFATLAEELGLIGALTILTLYVLLLWRGVRIALHAQTDFDRLLATGFTALLGFQTLLITAGVTGALPLSGMTLPFISSGKSSLIASFFLIGMLRGISIPTGSVPIGAPNPLFHRALRQYLTVMSLLLLGVVGIGRLFWIQAVRADEIAAAPLRTPDADGVVRAKINPRLLAVERRIPRGSIYDRNGRPLATSRLSEISQTMEDDPARARALFLKGRYYPYGPSFAHLVGYLHPMLGGPTGLEREYNATLRGFNSYRELVEDYRASYLPPRLSGRAPRRGADIYLTLDAEIQKQAVAVLQRTVSSLRDRKTGKPRERSALVIVQPATGEVLALASLPSYDPNSLTTEHLKRLTDNLDGSSRLLDRARSGYYPPGSTIKVAVAATALDAGIEPEYDCNHVQNRVIWRYKNRTYARRQLRDDKGDPPHNVIRMDRALRQSCNLYFANLGLLLGPERLQESLSERFRIRMVKPVNLFAEDLPDNAFGQGTMLVSPIEMACIAASVANRGRMLQPLYVREIRHPTGKTNPLHHAAPFTQSMSPETAQRLQEMMLGVTRSGTARGVFSGLLWEVAGKTGTAQTDTGDGVSHSWFMGFAPADSPRYAFSCIIENGGYGRSTAAPAVRQLLETLQRERVPHY
jgi:cell division protein FtsI/penicillin-binding protein 2/cell division protein FtsW (lipid II flippase)/DNA uptake protein ComE-like DNA-binding protein